MGRLVADRFLTELTRLLVKCNQTNTGSVQLTFKRYAPNEEVAARAASSSSSTSSPPHRSKQKLKPKAAPTPTPSNPPSSTPPTSTPTPLHPTSEVSPSDEPALLVHARLGSTKLSTVVLAAASTKFRRDLCNILMAKSSEGLLEKGGGGGGGGGNGGRGGVVEGERKRERRKAEREKRKRAVEAREGKVKEGKASAGQVKRQKREDDRKATQATSHKKSKPTPPADVDMKEAN